ncbi:DUF2793 domain-containing protein [Flavimaricola marinus]|uniref:Uncharacterized protein n=1 Tax=Flavimaricola marinus TaxID=1819565 RepID=A0A238LI16_9RHOB|nr:DUF2793 domain-containing protein [Flavimaricola marinus]SMY09252.1 hypothetical protein LOM8899_03417 [Flavimaricola marinus]
MTDISARLALPYLQPNQAQKHVTHNEALSRLDVLVQLTLETLGATTPPGSPVEGAVYGLGAAPTGAWAGQPGALAARIDGAWLYFVPQAGWRAWSKAEAALFVYTGGDWANVSGAVDFDNLDGVGIGTSSDPINRLAVSSEATLLNNAGAGHQLKLNKAAAGDTASLLYQTGFSGRAEMGLAGNDDFSVKVSPDGGTWTEAMRMDATTGMTRVTGIRGVTLSLDDDSVATIIPPSAGGFVFITITDDTYPQAAHSAILVYDVGGSPALQTMAAGSLLNNQGSTVLTGTTGPDGRTNVSAQTGSLLLENRFGNTRDFNLTFIGG